MLTELKMRKIKERELSCTLTHSNPCLVKSSLPIKPPLFPQSAQTKMPAFLWASLASKIRSSFKRSIRWHPRLLAWEFSWF